MSSAVGRDAHRLAGADLLAGEIAAISQHIEPLRGHRGSSFRADRAQLLAIGRRHSDVVATIRWCSASMAL